MLTPNTRSESGFTLIELLVTLAIIGILMAIAGAGVVKAIDVANRNAASAECTSIAGAVEVFYREYGWMPVPPGDQGDATDLDLDEAASKGVIMFLLADEDISDLDVVNPKKRVFLDVDSVVEDGELLDPWGNQYLIMLDANYDNRVVYQSTEFTTRAVVWSRGDDLADDEDDVANVVVPDP